MTPKMQQLKAEIDAENINYANLMAKKQKLYNAQEINSKKLIAHHNKYDALRKQYNEELKKSWVN